MDPEVQNEIMDAIRKDAENSKRVQENYTNFENDFYQKSPEENHTSRRYHSSIDKDKDEGIFKIPFIKMRSMAQGRMSIPSLIARVIGFYIFAFFLTLISNVVKYEWYEFSLENIINCISFPVLSVLLPAIIIGIMNPNKSFGTILSTYCISMIPMVISEYVSLVGSIVNLKLAIFSPIASMFSVISTVLGYFAICYLFEEKADSADNLKRFAIVKVSVSYIFLILRKLNFLM